MVGECAMWVFILTLFLNGEMVKYQAWHLPTERRCVEVWKKVDKGLATKVRGMYHGAASPKINLTKCERMPMP